MTELSKAKPLEFFKARERELEHTLPERKFYVVRLDGKAFHTFTKIFKAPFDYDFMHAMDASAKYVIKAVLPSALFAYVQSDEMSIVFGGTHEDSAEVPYGGRIEKLLSLAAAAATGGFMKKLPTEAVPLFDARMLVLENGEELADYVTWRRLDARKNAISMAAEQVASHEELMGKSTRERIDLLQGTQYERLPEEFMNGRFLVKTRTPDSRMVFDKAAGRHHEVKFVRTSWESYAAERELAERLARNEGRLELMAS